jgi:hypothetical protein
VISSKEILIPRLSSPIAKSFILISPLYYISILVYYPVNIEKSEGTIEFEKFLFNFAPEKAYNFSYVLILLI